MKIIIDTSVDSKEDIQKIARFLLDNSPQSAPVIETPEVGSFNLFDNNEPSIEPQIESATEPTSENLLNEEPVKEQETFKINDLIPYE
jgi:hypothetical protein